MRIPSSIELERAPDVQLLGGSVAVISGAAAIDAYRLVTEGIALVRRRDGIEPSTRLLRTVAALKAAAEAARATDTADIADVRTSLTSASLRNGTQVGVAEAADLVGVGARQIRRLAPNLGGVKTRSGWRFDTGLLAAYLETEGRT